MGQLKKVINDNYSTVRETFHEFATGSSPITFPLVSLTDLSQDLLNFGKVGSGLLAPNVFADPTPPPAPKPKKSAPPPKGKKPVARAESIEEPLEIKPQPFNTRDI